MNQIVAEKLIQQGGSLCLEDWAIAWAELEYKLRASDRWSFGSLKASLIAEATAAIRSGELPIRSALNGKERPFREDDNTELQRCRVRILPTSISHWLSCRGLTPFDGIPTDATAVPDNSKPRAEPDTVPPPAAAGSVTHRVGSIRSAALATEIEVAKQRAPDPTDSASVWGELTKLAETGFGNLIGLSNDGVQHRGKRFFLNGEPDVFTVKNLQDRMSRRNKTARASTC